MIGKQLINIMKNFKEFTNEGLTDKMIPKSDKEIDDKIDQLFRDLIDMGMADGYTQNREVVKSFFDWKWKYITELALEGWHTKEIYSNLQGGLEYYCENDEDE